MKRISIYSVAIATLLAWFTLSSADALSNGAACGGFQMSEKAQHTPAPASAEQKPGASTARFTPPQLKLRTFHTVFVHSDTVYLKTEDLRNTVMKRVEMHAWKIDVAGKDTADVLVEVTRPFLTFDWNYRMTDRATGEQLAAGRIVAWDGRGAAEGIAADIARVIARVRPLPIHLIEAATVVPNSPGWELEYMKGSAGTRKGGKVTVFVSPERIVGRRGNRLLFVIPTKDISGVGYNPHTTDPSKGWDTFWGGAFSNVGDDPNALLGAFALVPVLLGGEQILKGFKSEQHLCEIAWMDGSVMRNVVLKAPDKETAQKFLAAVEKPGRRKAIDMGAQSIAIGMAIARDVREGRSIPVQLDRKVAVGWKTLEPDLYRVIVLEEKPGLSIAYFLDIRAASMPPELQTISAQVPVEIEPGVPESAEPQVGYREVDGITSLDSIITADKTLRFRAFPLELAAEPQISEEMAELLAEAALRPKYHSIQVNSDTVYLKRETMERALAQHPAIGEWGIEIVPRRDEADLALLVTRPFLTFDWTYTVTDVKTGKKIADGKITARDGGRAATVIADQIVNALKVQAAQEAKPHVE